MKKIASIIAVICLLASINASAQVFRLGVGLVGVSPAKDKVGFQVPLIDLGFASMYFGIYTSANFKGEIDDFKNETGEASGGFRVGARGRYFFMADKAFRSYAGV
jgi:hypothetical protein